MARRVAQLSFPEMGSLGTDSSKPVTVERPNYGVSEDLFDFLKSGDKAQTQQAIYSLRSGIIGFDGTETVRTRLHLPDLGIPHIVLLNMTPAEGWALYSGIDRYKQDFSKLGVLNGFGTAECISELVKEGFRVAPWPLQVIAKASPVPGYDTGKGGLLKRMREVLYTSPDADKMFRDSAISTIRPLSEDINHVHRLGLDELIAGLAGRFAWKYEKEARASQAPVTAY